MSTFEVSHRRMAGCAACACLWLSLWGCAQEAPLDVARVSGYVEAEDVVIASELRGRLVEIQVDEGDHVQAGQLVARLDTTDLDLALEQAYAERDGASARVRLLTAGSRPEDLRQAEAQVAAAASDLAGARAELAAAESDLKRTEVLLEAEAVTVQQRDDAVTRRDVSRERAQAAEQRVEAWRATLARLQAGARAEEIDAARAELAAVRGQIARLAHDRSKGDIRSPLDGVVTEKLSLPGELLGPMSPIVVVTDLDHAWANVYLDEPLLPRVRLNQDATLFTDAGGAGIVGRVTFVSTRAEFTPRNVQTVEERAKLVYRIKISVDNTQGVLKPGMPVEAELALHAVPPAP